MKRQTLFALLLIFALLCSSTHVTAQQAPTKKYVIFRDDDVSPNDNITLLEAVNRVHTEEDVPVTLGIIPHPNGAAAGNELLEPTSFLTYMRSIASSSLFEFAQHGYTHIDNGLSSFPSEFCAESYPLQADAIKKGHNDMIEAFGVRPTTFIPPYDRGDENTLKAVKALGFTEYSTGLSDINMLKGHDGVTKVEAMSLDVSGKDLLTMKNLTEQLLTRSYDGSTLTIMYHIWSFKGADGPADARNVTVFRNYIEYLKSRGDIVFTRFDRSFTTAGGGTAAKTSVAMAQNLSRVAQPSGDSASLALANRQETLPIFLPVGLIVIISPVLVMFAKRWRQTKSGPKD